MDNSTFDVIIVGARCAGASLATYLAREGLSVLVVDKDKLPSDQVISTHTIHARGMDILDELGVGDAIRENCPPSPRISFCKNGATLNFSYAGGRSGYCPRRERLDGLLQDAARDAGVEVLDRTKLIGLIEEDGRVVGVRVSVKNNGQEKEFRSKLVVGADGRHSTLAKLVGADEYLGYDGPRAFYWAYWDTPDMWESDPDYNFDLYIAQRNGDIRTIFQTDNNQLLIGAMPSLEEAKTWKTDPLNSLKSYLSLDPLTHKLVEDAEPDGQVRGTVRERYFFRQATGPGWALVGDAGHHKEFVIGDGITEAFIQAKSLAKAILKESDQALVQWWRARDVEALPLFFFGQDEGVLPSPPEIQSMVFSRVANISSLKERLALVFEHQVSPYEVFPVPKIFQWTLVAALKGNFSMIPQFLQMGKRASMVQKEMKHRERLLEEAL